MAERYAFFTSASRGAEGQRSILGKRGPTISSSPQARPFKGPSSDSVVNIVQGSLQPQVLVNDVGVWGSSSSQRWELQGSEVATSRGSRGMA